MTDPSAPLQRELAGRYRLGGELGRGGMAVVYRAHDLKHDRPVALKVLHSHLSAALGQERFQREIRVAARLQHPHVLTVLDSGEAEGLLWFTMPLVEGETLRQRLQRERRLPLAQALRIAREAAEALHYAHEHGIVHRDVKPENILLTRDGNTLVADFGIARTLLSDGTDPPLTETGFVVGTAGYMSPEQATGDRQLDGRSDVYALGAVLYEMLAGETAFRGRTVHAIIAQRLSEPTPSVRQLRPELPAALDDVIRSALALDPGERSNAADFGRSLDAVVTGAAPTRSRTRTVAAASRGWDFSRSWPWIAVLVLVIGLSAALATVLISRRPAEAGDDGNPGQPTRVAVLPFENLGDSSKTYFADGVTDAVRGKLTVLPGLEVIASQSSNQYRNSAKPPREIGRELDVQYLLVGKVRWIDEGPAGSRVQVSPELIDVRRGAARWQEPFEASLTDVFRVQSGIAEQVAGALGVALGSGERHALAARPTENLQAYETYLQAEASARSLGSDDFESLQTTAALYEQAVSLDSTFAEAWAQLSRALSFRYRLTPSRATAAASLRAAERAVVLAPDRGEGHFALGQYHHFVAGDPARALDSYTAALKLTPSNAELLTATALLEIVAGKWDRALEYLRRAQQFDPRSVWAARWSVLALLYLRRHPEALRAAERGLAIDRSNVDILELKAMVHLARGDLDLARGVVRAAAALNGPDQTATFFAASWDLGWVLEPAYRQVVLRARPSAFFDDRAVWSIVLAQTYALEGRSASARTYADSARLEFDRQLREAPEEAERMAFQGLAYAYLGRKREAIRAGERAVRVAAGSDNALSGPYLGHQLARIYVLTGEPDKAIDQLEQLLRVPYYLTAGWLRIDSNFEPLRSHPRFQALVTGS